MTQQLAGAVMVAVAVLLVALGVWAWRRRRRRDRGLVAPIAELPADATVVDTSDVLYVATTRHDQPLERLAIRGLGFRSAADVTVTDAGIALDLVGQPRVVIARDALVGADQSSVAIDKVVERGGLVRVVWRIGTGEIVDTYLRPRDRSARSLVDAMATLIAEFDPDPAPVDGAPPQPVPEPRPAPEPPPVPEPRPVLELAEGPFDRLTDRGRTRTTPDEETA